MRASDEAGSPHPNPLPKGEGTCLLLGNGVEAAGVDAAAAADALLDDDVVRALSVANVSVSEGVGRAASTERLSAAIGKTVSAKSTVGGHAKASDAVLKSYSVKRPVPDLSWVGLLEQTKTRKESGPKGAAMPKTVDAVLARF